MAALTTRPRNARRAGRTSPTVTVERSQCASMEAFPFAAKAAALTPAPETCSEPAMPFLEQISQRTAKRKRAAEAERFCHQR